MKYHFIAEHQGQFAVRTMCRVLKVAESGYYAWRKRPVSHRQQEDQQLSQQIQEVFEHKRATYGSPRIQKILARKGIHCGCKRVAR